METSPVLVRTIDPKNLSIDNKQLKYNGNQLYLKVFVKPTTITHIVKANFIFDKKNNLYVSSKSYKEIKKINKFLKHQYNDKKYRPIDIEDMFDIKEIHDFTNICNNIEKELTYVVITFKELYNFLDDISLDDLYRYIWYNSYGDREPYEINCAFVKI